MHDAGGIFGKRIRYLLRERAIQIFIPVREAFFHPRRIPRRFVMPAPDDDGGRIAKLFDHLPRLANRIFRESCTVVVAPLQRNILPDHHAHLIGHVIQRTSGNVSVHAYGVGVHGFHQTKIATVFFSRHGAEPGGTDVITALNEKAFVVNEPALIVGLLDDLTQPGAGDRRIHQAVFIPQCHANGIQVRFPRADGPPQFCLRHGQRQLHGMGAAFEGNRKVSLIAPAAEVGWRGGEPHGRRALTERAIANVCFQRGVRQSLRPVGPQDGLIKGGAPAKMQPHRRPDAARVGVLSLRRPGPAGTRVMLVKDPLHDRFMQRPDLIGIFVRAVHPDHQSVVTL